MGSDKVILQNSMLIGWGQQKVANKKVNLITSIFEKYNLSQPSIWTQFTSFSHAKYNYFQSLISPKSSH